MIVVGSDMDEGDVLDWLQKTAFTLPALEILTCVSLDLDRFFGELFCGNYHIRSCTYAVFLS